MNICIVDLSDYKTTIDPFKLFGTDAERISDACNKVMHNWLYPYEGCYQADHPRIHEIRKMIAVTEGRSLMAKYKDFLIQWYNEHPEEMEKEDASRKEWEFQKERQFRIIYGIAKKHGLHLQWLGKGVTCCGDQWMVYKNHRRIARIHCV